MKKFFRVMAQSETFQVPSQKAEGGQISKCNIVLQELGGKYENSYVATVLGEQAKTRFTKNDLVVAALRFSRLSRLAPGRAAEIASAACTRTASTVWGSTSL